MLVMPTADSHFRPDHWIPMTVEQPHTSDDDRTRPVNVWVDGQFSNSTDGEQKGLMNMEISTSHGDKINFNFHPDDLERLGILLTYTARRLKGELD